MKELFAADQAIRRRIEQEQSRYQQRAMRLICPGDRWIAMPHSTFEPTVLFVDGAPPGAWLRLSVAGDPFPHANGDGLPASLFTFNRCEVTSSRIDWPTVVPAIGISVELRNAENTLITEGVELTIFGRYLKR